MKGVHNIIFVLDNYLLFAFGGLVNPLVQSEVFEALSVTLLELRQVTGTRDDRSQFLHVHHDSFIVCQSDGCFEHVTLIIFKAREYVSRTALEESKLFNIVEGGDRRHAQVLVGVRIKAFKKFDR